MGSKKGSKKAKAAVIGSKKSNNKAEAAFMGKKKSNQRAEAVDGGGKGAQISGKQRRPESEKFITDSRFAGVHWDPRFQKFPKHKTKVSIDSRFDRMFSDNNFASSKARIDKRGKPKKDSSFEHPLKRFYRRSEEEENDKKNQVESEESESDSENLKKQSQVSSDSDLKSGSDSELDSESESKEEEDDDDDDDDEEEEEEEEEEEVRSDSGSTTDSEDEEEVYSEQEETFVPEENIPEIDKETHRLAVVNMDWGQVKAADLYVLLSSFLPKGGQISSVAVYPSEFGLQRMEEEAVHGPVSLFEDDKDSKDKFDDGDDDDEIDNEKLRAYELSRLRYYYAVVQCDSSATAEYLYKTCDGVEFERSSNKLDLRFIPDSMEFKHPPRDVATEAPDNYKGIDFQTRALQQSKIQLTWDEDEPQRAKTLKRKLNADQLAELELKELLASDESESDEVDEDAIERSAKKQKKQEMYKALIQSGVGSDGDGDSDDDGQDMEVTFNTGLEDISKRILEKKGKESETVWEAYLRKKKEKKKSRKNKSKDSSGDEGSDTDREPGNQLDDFFVEEPLSNGSKKAKHEGSRKGKLGQELTNDDEASRAELELILTDDRGEDTKLKGYNLKRKKAKGKRGKEMLDEGKLPTVDYDDPRFSALFTSPQFALDPTVPQFKRSAAYARQVAQKQHKGDRDTMGAKVDPNVPRPSHLSESLEREKVEHAGPDGLASKKEKHELSSLVKSIKMKSKQVSLPPNDKVSAKSRKLVVMKSKK